MSRKKISLKRLIILLIVAGALGIFNLVFAVSEVNNVSFVPGSDGALINISISGPKDYSVNKVGSLIIIDLKDSENNFGERTIAGDGNIVSEIIVTQYMRQPQKQVRITVKLTRDMPYNISKANGQLTVEIGSISGLKDSGPSPTAEIPSISEEEILIIATEKHITQMTDEADRLMEAKKYKEATALYNKIASGDYEIPKSVIDEVKVELGIMSPKPIPKPIPKPTPPPPPPPVPEPEPEPEPEIPPLPIPVPEPEIVTPPIPTPPIPTPPIPTPPIPTPTPTPEPTPPALAYSSISNILYSKAGNEVKYTIQTNKKPYYNFYPKTTGSGLIIELKNSLNASGLNSLQVDNNIVKSASLSVEGDDLLISLDFGPDSEYQIYPVGNNIVLSVTKKTFEPVPVAEVYPEPTPTPVYTPPAPVPTDVPPEQVYLDDHYVSEEPSYAELYSGYRVPPESEVTQIDVGTEGERLTTYSEMKIKTEDLSKDDLSIEKRKYKGMTPISMELEGADIKNFLRLISYKTNISIYSDPGVAGQVTIKLKDVPWEVALDSILKNLGFTYEWQGDSMIRVTKLDILESEKKLELEAKKMKQEMEPLITRIYTVSYSDPSDLRVLIKEQLTKRGEIDVNKRSNKIIVTDVVKSFKKVEKLISELDLETKQVNISTRIYRLNDITSKDLGVYWTESNIINPAANPTVSATSNLGPSVSSQGIGQIVIASQTQMGSIEAAITAYTSTNQLDLVTSPNVTTLNHVAAQIVIGQMVPITMLDDAGNTVTQLTTIGTKIIVTPHINAENLIIMQIHPEISALAGTTGEVNIATSEADTKVMVKDGDTAIIGGLTEVRETKSKYFIPGLHKIPILGLLAKNSSKTLSTAEILIFVTPRIVRL